MADNKIFIPTFISDDKFKPSRVLPRLFFYNGKKNTKPYYIDGWSNAAGSGSYSVFTEFPYYDHYNVVDGENPSENSLSLLFNNESAAYGTLPNQSLYSEYWDKYVQLLYNPYTRLLRTSAIIPLSEYFNLELNDIVQFRSNMYHLRSINDYNISTSECTVELLGPILEGSLNIGVAPTNYGDFNCDFNSDFDGKFYRSVC